MKIIRPRIALTLLLLAAHGHAQDALPKTGGNKGVYKDGAGGPMDSILLKDYEPESSLVVPRTEISRAKFPVIDVHTHTSQAQIKTKEDVTAWVRVMDRENIEMSVVFTGATGADFDRAVELFSAYPKRFQLWCSFDSTDIADPGYSARAVAELVRCYQKGARGLGEITDKGSGLQKDPRLPPAQRMHPDDPRMDPIFQKCAELRIPVTLHIADHPSNWKPLGPHQERTPPFQGFNQYGKDVSSFDELMAQRDRMLAKHPKTTFILCHLSNQAHDTATLAKTMERFPNVYLDISARDYEIGRQPRTAATFLNRYRTRIMFGTDMGRDQSMYEAWWRLLETPDEFLPGRVWWAYYGLNLPDSTLKSLYRETALKVLNFK